MRPYLLISDFVRHLVKRKEHDVAQRGTPALPKGDRFAVSVIWSTVEGVAAFLWEISAGLNKALVR